MPELDTVVEAEPQEREEVLDEEDELLEDVAEVVFTFNFYKNFNFLTFLSWTKEKKHNGNSGRK